MILMLMFPVGHTWCSLAPWHFLDELLRGACLSKMRCGICAREWAFSREPHRFGSVLPWDSAFESLALSSGWPAPSSQTKKEGGR